jgi:hypothetical protein
MLGLHFAKDPHAGPGWLRVGTNNGLELADIGNNGSFGGDTITFWEADGYCGKLLSR